MRATNDTENPQVGMKRDLEPKTNTELLDEITAMLESTPAEELDVDRIMANLGVLQERAPIAEEYDRARAWEAMPEAAPGEPEEPAGGERKKSPRRFSWGRVVGIAAALVLLLSVTVSAMGYDPIGSLIRWAGDVVQVFSNPSGVLELPDDSNTEYHSLREALDENGAENAECPTWIPKDYEVSRVTAKPADGGVKITAYYVSERGDLVISICSYDRNNIFFLEQDPEDPPEQINIGEHEYLITKNVDSVAAGWEAGEYTYYIQGNVTMEELESILKSM